MGFENSLEKGHFPLIVSILSQRGTFVFFAFFLESNQNLLTLLFFISTKYGILSIMTDLNFVYHYPRQNHHQSMKWLPILARWPLELEKCLRNPQPSLLIRCLAAYAFHELNIHRWQQLRCCDLKCKHVLHQPIISSPKGLPLPPFLHFCTCYSWRL
jgi:hypothetical protein